MRQVPPLLLAAFVLACTQEDPDDVFYWLGRVSDASGAPLPGATATLGTSPNWPAQSCSPTGRAAAQFSPDGFVMAPVDYAPLRQATGDADGAFYFDLMRFEISPTPQDTRCFSVSADGPGGSTARSAALGLPKDLEFPDLAQWEATFAVEPGPPARVALPALPWAPSRDGTQELEPGHTRRVYYDWTIAGPEGQLAWQQLTEIDPLVLEPELLEDFPGLSVTLQAWLDDVVERHGLLGSTDVTIYWTALQPPGAALSAGAAVPVSRGAPCTFDGAPYPGCPLTDGSLELATLPTWYQPPFGSGPGDPSAARDVVVLSLPRPAVPRLLVIRDLHGAATVPALQLSVEGSADGVSWFPLVVPDISYYPGADVPGVEMFSGSGAHLAQALDSGGQAVQQVRISTPPYFALLAAREISVFE